VFQYRTGKARPFPTANQTEVQANHSPPPNGKYYNSRNYLNALPHACPKRDVQRGTRIILRLISILEPP